MENTSIKAKEKPVNKGHAKQQEPENVILKGRGFSLMIRVVVNSMLLDGQCMNKEEDEIQFQIRDFIIR
ncbi:unnamed protein product (macronuclear) [Paramecium tetraurelia]|uniref:Uncharacterized protein n=1 Tax=Paramecium tetraurelia TaxID=5888 RepID=A0BL95_PARTE|nr:uncharacterized protein GSPATT00029944001 [Paramecium tetraurelia]CAK59312.1 unnamed protein product [Paramecium tetraurelia]|eukprot:XP_001426710.1 hypothetical protein (macronuclear) [Paramecium tetraurelia strain d4-2]